MKHGSYDEVLVLAKANQPVLVHGEKGSGKTTLMCQVSDTLGIPFYALSMTRQTTLSNILGFMNVNGIYVPTLFRKAIEFGGLFLFDEIDGADPNVMLCINTLENGFISFPDAMVEVHKDFRLAASANPFNKHSEYVGRAQLDASTLDRFDKLPVGLDPELEASLISGEALEIVTTLRKILKKFNSTDSISMRDSKRLDTRMSLNILKDFIPEQLLKNNPIHIAEFAANEPKKQVRHEDVRSVSRLWDLL